MNSITQAKARYESISWALDEKLKRLFAANEAKSLGHGGITKISQALGMARITIHAGIKELQDKISTISTNSSKPRTRREGGGRKKILTTTPTVLNTLQKIVEPDTRGDPESPLLWTSKSLRNLAEELGRLGYKISYVTVGKLLEKLGYSLQGE